MKKTLFLISTYCKTFLAIILYIYVAILNKLYNYNFLFYVDVITIYN